MASVINSARTSTASVFDLVGELAGTASLLVATATRSVEMLDAKARVLHESVTVAAKAELVLVRDREIVRVATDYVDIMEQVHKRNAPDEEFNRAIMLKTALEKIEAAVSN